MKLGKYDFVEDLSVNILGHIFEQSITDLEEIKRKIDNDKKPFEVAAPDPRISKRKKEGIFYTPDYVVRYIVEQTVGGFLREKEAALLAKHKLTGRPGERLYQQRERAAYLEYQTVLQNIKVLDPACGSGAFLVYVFDFLLLENARVDKILGGTLTSQEDFVRSILSDNIFGVDINEESVEITKLSLWLKTAQKGKKLTALDANIRCGNSLIDSEDHAPGKAFDWHKEFADIFDNNGGFDVVAGNPPYVNARTMSADDRKYLNSMHPELVGAYDLYIAFILKALDLLNDNGRYGWIIPNKFLIADYAKPTLELVSSSSLEASVDVSAMSVFDGVGVYPIIINGHKARPAQEPRRYRVQSSEELTRVEQHEEVANGLKRFKTFEDVGIKIGSGTTGFQAQEVKALLNEDGVGIPFAVSGGVDPYQLDTRVVPYMKRVFKSPHIAPDLPDIAESKYKFWNAPKIVVAGMTKRIEAVYVEEPLALGVGIYAIHDFAGIDPHALTAILNSSFMSYYLRTEFHDKHLAGGYLAINKSTIGQLPMARVSSSNSAALAAEAVRLADGSAKLTAMSERFIGLVSGEYKVKSWPRKLDHWWRLPFDDFYAALGLRLGLAQKDDLLSYFAERGAACQKLDDQLTAALARVDEIVYKIYRLTADEIVTVKTPVVTAG